MSSFFNSIIALISGILSTFLGLKSTKIKSGHTDNSRERINPKNSPKPKNSITIHRPTIRERKTVKLEASKLKVGMYVSELDRPWLETPFSMQGFQILHESEIDEVMKHCQYVYIDTYIDKKLVTPEGRKKGHRTTVQQHYSISPRSIETWGDETKSYKRSSTLTKSILDEIRLGGTVNNKAMKEVVNQCVDSVLNDPNALIWISRMSNTQKSLETHALSCCVLSIGFGRHLDFSKDRMKKLGMSALLHDVGILKLPKDLVDAIYQQATLSEKDMNLVRRHTTYGRDALASNKSYWGAVDVAYCHHERYDGMGYPRGLKGKSIPLYASIVSIIDAYDALTSPNSYQKALASVEAMKVIYSERGKQFDPSLAKSFIRYIGLYPLGSIVQLKNGEIGVVVKTNPYFKHLPTILVLLGADYKEVDAKIVDLQVLYKEAKIEQLFIKKEYPSGSFGINAERLIKDGIIRIEE